ncbi:MAG: nucleotide exchange factor GrpE, partial [Nitrospirota bacterium]|nr:nucleotide exchange factor GrpE [Nitrospirota bacterium]
MRHKAKKNIEKNMAVDNSHQEFHELDSQTAEEAARCIAAETQENAASRNAREKFDKNLLVDSTLREGELGQEKVRYLRLYAEFDNYKKRVARDKEELIKYGNESLLYELLPVI